MSEQSFKYSFKETRKENTGLTVYNSGFQQCEPGYGWGPAVRDHYLLHYVSSGTGEFYSPEGAWSLAAGSLFLAWPGSVIQYMASWKTPWEYYWVGFHGADTRWLLAQTAFRRERPVHRLEERAGEAEAKLAEIYEARGSLPANDAAMTGRLYLLLSFLMEEHPAPQTVEQSREHFEKAVRYIASSVERSLSVEEIAGYVGLSRSQLYRVFRRESGMAPVEFLNQYRINKAGILLGEQAITVAQAAASVGFEDPLYFSKVFKRIKGVPPGEYRER